MFIATYSLQKGIAIVKFYVVLGFKTKWLFRQFSILKFKTTLSNHKRY